MSCSYSPKACTRESQLCHGPRRAHAQEVPLVGTNKTSSMCRDVTDKFGNSVIIIGATIGALDVCKVAVEVRAHLQRILSAREC